MGATEENVRKAIATIESIGRCCVLIDEMEKSMNTNAVSGAGDSGTSSRMFATLLSWLNDRTCPAFIVATSNNFTIMPPELLRKGRFDELFWLDLPDQAERKEIWNVVIKKYKRDPKNFSISDLASKSDGFVGSEIEAVFQSAMYDAFYKDKEVEDDHVINQLKDTQPQSKVNQVSLDKMRDAAKGKLRSAREMCDIEKSFRNIEQSLS